MSTRGTNNGDGTWSATLPATDPGEYNVTVTATTPDGQTATDTATMVVQDQAPMPVLTAVDVTSVDPSPALSGTINDAGANVVVTLTINGTPRDYTATNNGDGTWTLNAGTYPDQSLGSHIVNVVATNATGNDNASLTLTINETIPAPTLALINDNPMSVIAPYTAGLAGTVSPSDATVTVTLSVNGTSTTYPTSQGSGSNIWTITDTTDPAFPSLAVGTYDAVITAENEGGSDEIALQIVVEDAQTSDSHPYQAIKFDGSGSTYYDTPGVYEENYAASIGFWLRADANDYGTGGANPISAGTGAGGFLVKLHAGAGVALDGADIWEVRTYSTDAGTETKYYLGEFGADAQWRLVVGTSTPGTDTTKWYVATPGATAQLATSGGGTISNAEFAAGGFRLNQNTHGDVTGFNGAICQAFKVDVELSADQITQLAGGQTIDQIVNPLVWNKLDGPDDIYDYALGDNTLTAHGTGSLVAAPSVLPPNAVNFVGSGYPSGFGHTDTTGNYPAAPVSPVTTASDSQTPELWDGLASAYLASEDQWLLSGAQPAYGTDASLATDSTYGQILRWDTTSDTAGVDVPLGFDPTQPFTLFTFVKEQASLSDDNFYFLIGGSGGYVYFKHRAFQSNSTYQVTWADSTGSYQNQTGDTWGATGWIPLFFTWDGSALTVYNGADQKLSAASTTLMQTALSGAASGNLIIGGMQGISSHSATEYDQAAAYAWSRALTADERTQLAADPFVLFRAPGAKTGTTDTGTDIGTFDGSQPVEGYEALGVPNDWPIETQITAGATGDAVTLSATLDYYGTTGLSISATAPPGTRVHAQGSDGRPVQVSIRHFADGGVCIENMYAGSRGDCVLTDVSLVLQSSTPQTLFSGSVTVFPYTRTRPFWYTQPTIKSSYDTSLLPNYGSGSENATTVDAYRRRNSPMDPGPVAYDQGGTGDAETIGLLPRWDACYATNPTADNADSVRAMADAAAVWRFHVVDPKTNKMLVPADYPNASLLGNSSIQNLPGNVTKHGYGSDQKVINGAHLPAYGYMAAVVYGTEFDIEETEMCAVAAARLNHNPGYCSDNGGPQTWDHILQTRQTAWQTRSVAYASAAGGEFASLFANWADLMCQSIVDNFNAHPERLITTSHYRKSAAYFNGLGLPPWQYDYVGMSLGIASQLGVASANTALNTMGAFYVERLSTTPVNVACVYMVAQRKPDGNGGYIYATSWAEMLQFAAEHDGQIAAALNAVEDSQDMADILSSSDDQLQPGDFQGYPTAPGGYVAWFKPAIAYCVDNGVTDAATVYPELTSRERVDFSQDPRYNIVPV